MSLFIGRLPKYDFTERDLKRIFEKYGDIRSYNIRGGSNFGYGFVNYYDEEDAREAIRCEHGRKIDGMRIVVEPASSGDNSDPRERLHVDNHYYHRANQRRRYEKEDYNYPRRRSSSNDRYESRYDSPRREDRRQH